MKNLIKVNGLLNLIERNTCFKAQGSSIDLIFTNRRSSIKHSNSCETAIIGHDPLIYSMLRCNLSNTEPKLVNYRFYKGFSFEDFKTSLDKALRHHSNDYKHFEYIFMSTLNQFAQEGESHLG